MSAKITPSFGEVSTEPSSSFESPEEFDGTDYNLDFTKQPARCSTFQNNKKQQKVTEPKSSRRKGKSPKKIKSIKNVGARYDGLGTNHFAIPRLPFSRIVREIMCQCTNFVTMITPEALEALQHSAEVYTSQRLQDAYLLTLHRDKLTLTKKDLDVLNIIQSMM